MSIFTTGDFTWRMSVPSGPGGTFYSGYSGSYGGFVSNVAISGTFNRIFPDVTVAQDQALTVDYVCLFLCNNNILSTLVNPVVYISSQVSGGADIQIGVDPTAQSLLASSSGQAVSSGGNLSPPSGVTFSAPTTLGAALSLGTDIMPGYVKALWLQRTCLGLGVPLVDGVGLTISGGSSY